MLRKLLLPLFCFVAIAGFSQTYSPVVVVGYNHDVIAESTGPSSEATTTKEMDAFTPSNFVICTEEFAAANSIPLGYGIPNSGSISNGNKSYQLAPLGDGTTTFNNVVYLMKGETGTLTLATPATFTNLSFLVTATEGNATVNITVNYTDGTNQTFTGFTFLDWINGTNPIISGFGRIKRIAGPFPTGTYEQAPTNPMLYSADVAVSCSKLVSSIDFNNVSSGSNTGSNRAFIFAVSGAQTALPPQPTVPADTICSGQNAVLTVQSPATGFNYSWYTAQTGGGALAAGTTYTTPALTASTTYYVQSANTGGCASPRTAVTVTVLTVADPAAADVQICSGQSATLSVTNPLTGFTYSWYSAATGGTPLASGTGYSTPALTTATTYYLQAQNDKGCNSARVPVNVSILPALASPVAPDVQVCAGQLANLAITNPDPNVTYSWYTSSTGGTPFATGTTVTTAANAGTNTVYVQSANSSGCTSAFSPVLITVLPALATPLASVSSICPGQTATITITNADPANTYSWYSTAIGGAVIFTGTTFTTPVLTATTTYYVEASNAGGCTSARADFTVTVLPALANPAVSASTICSGQTATLSITNADASNTYTWYDAATGGAVLFTGSTYTTPALTVATTYYLEASNAGGCKSDRIAVTVNILPALSNPVAAASSICSGQVGTITITGADPANIYTWYDAATGGTVLSTGSTFTTPALNASTTYYVEASNSGGCRSGRVAVTVNVLPALTTPAATAAEVCSGQPGLITITNPDPSVIYSYYTSATGGVVVGTGTTFNTPTLTAPATYYIEASNAGGCISSTRTAVTVTVAQVLSMPVVTVSNVTTSSATVTWPAVTGAVGYEISVNGGSFTNPSSGATGTTHTVNGLAPGQTVTFAVRAIAAVTCRNSLAGTATAVTPSNNDVYIPNVFTPNGDGKNDMFMVYGTSIESLNMKIFNQWGEMAFETRDRTKGWDGISRGKAQPVGVYVYVVSITLKNGTTMTRKGSLNLIR